jgi:hypothetical protein
MGDTGDEYSDTAEDYDEANDIEDGHEQTERRHGAASGNSRNADREAERVASIEGVNSEVAKFLEAGVRRPLRWCEMWDRFKDTNLPAEWRPWGKVGDNAAGHLSLRDPWLTWMACTSKVLQTVDNRHLNRHEDYLHAGPSIHFVDLQDTPQIGRRLQALGHFVECINNLGEFPLDCVVPTPETELLFGQGKSCKTVRGMRMKNAEKRISRTAPLTSTTARSGEKWLKSFRRGERLPRMFVCMCSAPLH